MNNDPSPPAVSAAKAEARTRMRAELKRVTPAVRTVCSRRAAALLRDQESWRKARSILFYAALPDELDLSALWLEAASCGKTAALPRFDAERGVYEAARLLDPSAPLTAGRFGIREPGPAAPGFPLNQLDFVLVPGVAFDLLGTRLGRGKGFYDRLLAQVHGVKCGVGFDFQVQTRLPAESHDVVLNCLLTPARWVDCKPVRP